MKKPNNVTWGRQRRCGYFNSYSLGPEKAIFRNTQIPLSTDSSVVQNHSWCAATLAALVSGAGPLPAGRLALPGPRAPAQLPMNTEPQTPANPVHPLNSACSVLKRGGERASGQGCSRQTQGGSFRHRQDRRAGIPYSPQGSEAGTRPDGVRNWGPVCTTVFKKGRGEERGALLPNRKPKSSSAGTPQ